MTLIMHRIRKLRFQRAQHALASPSRDLKALDHLIKCSARVPRRDERSKGQELLRLLERHVASPLGG